MYKFTISELFKAVRLTLNINQKDMSQILGVAQSTVSKAESGYTNLISFEVISNFSKLTKTDIKCFQVGLLNSSSSKLDGLIHGSYTTKGEFSAKSIFLVLEGIRALAPGEIYRELEINRLFLAYEKLKFSCDFIQILVTRYPLYFFDSCKNVVKNLNPQNKVLNLEDLVKNHPTFKIVKESNLGSLIIIQVNDSSPYKEDLSIAMLTMLYVEICIVSNRCFSYQIYTQNKTVLMKVSAHEN